MRKEQIEQVLVFVDGLLEERYTEEDFHDFIGRRVTAEDWLALEEASEGAGVPVSKRVTRMYIPKKKAWHAGQTQELYITPKGHVIDHTITGVYVAMENIDDYHVLSDQQFEVDFVPYRITLDPKELYYNNHREKRVILAYSGVEIPPGSLMPTVMLSAPPFWEWE